MIIDITIENFRSIRERTTFSLFAEHPGRHLTENIAHPSNDKIGVLKTAGIYGANASGKSNLLLAIWALRYIICESGSLKDGDEIACYEPFLLSEETENAPVRFEVEFFAPDNVRYLYKVSFTKSKIENEQLTGYASGQPALLFSRKESDTWETIKFGTTFKGGRKRMPFFSNNTYLSKAGNSADAPESIRSIFNYFRGKMVHLTPGRYFIPPSSYNINKWAKDKTFMQLLSSLLYFTDTGISGVRVEERDTASLKLPEDIPDEFKEQIRNDMKWNFLFSHTTEEDKIVHFDINQESGGTQRLFALAPMILHSLDEGLVVLLDKLETSMHPFMAELIIRMFNDPDVNPGKAQLIFTTHNVHVMSSDLLRRDQVWFSEKEEGASRYFSLNDFDKNKVKANSPFSRWYLEGRFNAIPTIDYRKIADIIKAFKKSNAQEEK